MTEPRTPVTEPRTPPTDLFERVQPYIAILVMAVTFTLLPQAFAVALIALVWVIATRGGGGRQFLGLTLTQGLAWAATLVIFFLCLTLLLYALGARPA